MLKKSSAVSSLFGVLALATILVGSTAGYLILQPLGNEPIGAGVITRVQYARGTSTYQTSCPVTLNSAPISGNVLIATFSSWGYTNKPIITSITQTGVTWSKVVSVGGDMNGEIWFGVVGTGASTSVTVNMGSGSGTNFLSVCNICEYSGVQTTGFTDKTSTATGDSTTNCLTGTTATTTQASELWIGNIATLATTSNSYSMTTPLNGFALLDGNSITGPYKVYYIANTYLEYMSSSTGAASSGATAGRPVYYEGCIATFKATNTAPNAPTNISPAAGYRYNPSSNVTFSWTFSDPDAGDYQTAYQFQLADTPIFSPPLINTFKTTSASQQTTQTLPATVDGYYWHVKTWDSHDVEGPYNICVTEAIIVDQVKVAVMGAPGITGGLVLYSSMNEGAGTSALDLSPYNNVGTVYGASWVDGKYGKALSFDGASNYVEVAANSPLFPSNTITMELWVKIASADINGNTYMGFVCRNTRTNGLQVIKDWGDGRVLFETPGVGNLMSTVALTPDIWNHVVCVLVSGSSATIYINGQPRGSSSGWALPTTSMNYWIGRAAQGTTNPYFKGAIDEVRVYNRALTQAEILQLYRIGNSRQNVGEQTVLAVKLAYEYDGAPITSGAFTLNGLTLTHQGSGVWTATDSKGSVQLATYNGVGGTEGVYSLTTVNPNGASTTVIWDRIKLTACGILNNVVDTRTGGKVWYQAVYEYSVASFSSASGTLYLNSTAMAWATDRWTYDFNYGMSGSQAVFQVTGVADTNYGLTTINNAAGNVVLNWATMGITISKP